jgi:proteasome lid subunit RPN8/RPN11
MLKEPPPVLRLSRRAEAEIARHARAALPREAVGLIGGAAGVGARVFPLPNIAGERAFLADPYAQYLALKEMRANGLELLAIYHSHPGGGTEPSAGDIGWGAAWDCAHVIMALRESEDMAGGGAVRMRAWRFGPGVGEARALEVVVEAA